MVLGGELADVVLKRYGAIDYEWGISSASTDFVSPSTKLSLNDKLVLNFRRVISLTVCMFSVLHMLFTDLGISNARAAPRLLYVHVPSFHRRDTPDVNVQLDAVPVLRLNL